MSDDVPAGRAIAPNDTCGIPVEDMWISNNPDPLAKQLRKKIFDASMNPRVVLQRGRFC
jgi:hypothetical protein